MGRPVSMRLLLMLLNMTGVPRLVIKLMLDSRVPMRLKMILPAALLYLVSPFDLIRDMIPVVGRIDDVLVLAFALVLFLGKAPKYLVTDHARGDRVQGPESDGKVIDGSYRFIDEPED
jgi:uncharacterized membrane protein YkvA (DUF1232 family)